MQHLPFDGAWYGDVSLDHYAVLLADRVLTDSGELTFPAGWNPLYTCIPDAGPFQIAGQATDVKGTSHYYDGQWHLDPRIAHGNFGCIFDLTGTLHIIEPAPDQTTGGYRYVWPDGTPSGQLWLGDETILANEVSKFIDLSDAQDRSFLIGQGHSYPGVVVFLDGVHRSLYKTDKCDAVRARRYGQIVCIYFYEVVNGLFRGHLYRMTVDELKALPSISGPVLPAPKITVLEWDGTIVAKPNDDVEWFGVSFRSMDTDFHVYIDTASSLRIASENASGKDATGLSRLVTVEGFEQEPQPMPLIGRFQIQPNIGAKDKLDIFTGDYKANLAGVTGFVLYAQELTTDTPTDQLGPNTYPAHVEAGTFAKLRELGIPLLIEKGVVKPHDCDAQGSINGIQTCVQRVADAGGEIAAFNMDEPLTANQYPVSEGGCQLPVEQVARYTANFMRAVYALGPMQINWLEAWPEVDLTDWELFLSALNREGVLPEACHADIDYVRAKKEGKDIAKAIAKMQEICNRYNVTFGLFVNSTVDPIDPDKAHYDNLVALANKIHSIHPSVAHLCIASWAHRVAPDPTHKTQNVPNCFGQYGMLETYKAVQNIFGDILPPQPSQPEPEIDPMDYKLVDYVLRLKKTISSSGQGKVNGILPNDRVAKITPDGFFQTSDPGTDFDWEQAYLRDNLLLYEPVPGKRYAVSFKLEP